MEFSSKHRGADVPHRKSTAQMESSILPPPGQVILPMQQHAGAPCKPLVKIGDEVLVGQKIADSDAFIGAPIHASISGKVSAIKKLMLPGGQYSEAVVIDSDGEMKVSPEVQPPVIKSPEDLVKAARESGLVGLGGAGFPTHVKLNVPKDKKLDTLIINAAECEPYITADNREVLENTQSIFDGISVVRHMLKIDRVILAIEDNKPNGIQKLKELADSEKNAEGSVHILTLPSRYPQGAEKVLVKACTDREIPMGKLPADVGCLVMNVTSVAFLADYIKTGMPLIKKRVTIDGSAIQKPQNVIVPIGTKIGDVIQFCGGYRAEPKKLLMGGPMMGLSLPDDSFPILKQNNGILAFDEREARMNKPTSCIRCGRCVNGCPMRLIPTQLERYSNAKDIEKLQEYDVMDCIECGCCAFNCPANRPLVQAIRLGKALVKAGGKH
ncbi:electron transport complex subunit RsxC [Caproiciproducens galactitolivorans]|uniref:Ion-translocating oxidoreductase complex subunit C n=1 Tax=Caproiciproducens galactitolivorans TaxID=642589 RepID=A0A4Z0XYS5_9FIRM|nr:electron transport complex subunit RsxC [Caproiciproducens galactitolivorans]QEY33775.1 electron transport complex subunit RsxC [Caproiciproducens galactitolivorans]TGJ75647.1 electron transport complex subunit RnfC [Caproiciproducens galactitolivorans]